MNKMSSLICLILFMSLSFLMNPCALFADELTMTTYYPAPSGKYQTIQTTDATITRDLHVDGVLYADNFQPDNLDVLYDLTVYGTTTLHGPLISDHPATFANPFAGAAALTVDGKGVFNHDVTIEEDANIYGTLTTDSLTVSDLTVTHTAAIDRALTIGTTTVSTDATLDVRGNIIQDGGSGDVDGDGEATMDDAMFIFDYVLLGSPAFTRAQLAKADYDGNGLVTMEDSFLILGIVPFLPPNLSCFCCLY